MDIWKFNGWMKGRMDGRIDQKMDGWVDGLKVRSHIGLNEIISDIDKQIYVDDG